MIKLDIFQKPYVNALRALRKVRPLPSHEHYYMSNATIINYFTIFLQIVVMANYYWFSFGPTTNITISISNNHFWWAFCDFGLNCLLLHQAQVFQIKSQDRSNCNSPQSSLRTNYAPFSETLVTCPWQAKLLQKSYGR